MLHSSFGDQPERETEGIKSFLDGWDKEKKEGEGEKTKKKKPNQDSQESAFISSQILQNEK